MALVNWNPVTAANFSESNALRLAAQQQLAGGIKGIGDTAVAFNDATGKANTDILLNSLVGQRTPEAAMAAIQAAKAQAGGMYNNYDQAAFRSAAEALPKSAADAQELDLQTADKPYLQAAALAYSRGDREAVGNFAKEVRSNAGRAELSKLIGDSHTMAVQDAGVVNAEKTLTANIKDNQAKNDIAWYNAKTQRYEAGRKSGTGSETAKNTFLNMVASVRQKFKTAADKAGTEALIGSQDTVESKAALQNTINGKDGKGLDSWGNATGKNIHDVLLATVPGYAGTGAKNQKAVIDYLLAKNTTQTGGGWWDSMVNRDLNDEQITTLGATALGEVKANASTNLARTQELGIQDGVSQLRLEAEKLGIQATDAELREMLFPSAVPQPAAANTPPPKPKEDPKAAEQYLKDKAELAAREAKRQADLAAGKGNPTSVKGRVVTPPRYPVPVSAGNPVTNDPILKAAATAIKSAATTVANTTNAAPNTGMLQGGGNGFLGRSVAPVNTNGLTTIAKGVSNLATTPVPEAIGLAVDAYKAKPVNTSVPTKPIDVPKAAAKIVAAVKTAPSNISAVTDVSAQVAAAQAKAKVPTPVTPTVIKATVKQDAKGTTPIAKSSQSGTWETMFKKVADKANEVVAGKGWSNDPKNQDQYENGLIVDGETTQPSSKHEISIMGMWDKNNNVRSQFLGDYDTFKGYAVKVKVKGGGEYVIPLTYDEIAAHTGANREDILRAGTNDIRGNAVVQRRVYRTALDKLNTQLGNSKGK